MTSTPNHWQRLLCGLYTWMVTVFFGAILLDVVYFHTGSGTTDMFQEGSDFLLLLGMLTALAGIGAVAASWGWEITRNYFLTSFLILSVEFISSMLSPLLQWLQASPEFNLGTYIRLVGSLLPTVLAFGGLVRMYRTED